MDSPAKTLTTSRPRNPAKKSSTSRRTPSFSLSSSSSNASLGSYFIDHHDSSLLSPATPLRFSGVPFSWEQLPGIPKNSHSHNKKESIKLLPLPPPAIIASKKYTLMDFGLTRKKFYGNHNRCFRLDPFFAAFVECSKDDDDDEQYEQEPSSHIWRGNGGGGGTKVSKSISDRFGLVNLQASCKRSIAVSESLVYLPRSSRSSYDLVNHR
ncbi:uncharacterized protein LOC110813293 [Carica papaya]|uniref:uncharacterized protein LOC110813293 n=1 Tax=Carica papaya TaxID=3649 RepID=UPI000B8D0501|nr:uncharacterized protein LOC110813293 [Carica papaya]